MLDLEHASSFVCHITWFSWCYFLRGMFSEIVLFCTQLMNVLWKRKLMHSWSGLLDDLGRKENVQQKRGQLPYYISQNQNWYFMGSIQESLAVREMNYITLLVTRSYLLLVTTRLFIFLFWSHTRHTPVSDRFDFFSCLYMFCAKSQKLFAIKLTLWIHSWSFFRSPIIFSFFECFFLCCLLLLGLLF